MPRFAFEKFPGADDTLGTSMKAVGEAMGIGRNYIQGLNKVMRSMEDKPNGFWTRPDAYFAEGRENDLAAVLDDLRVPTDKRLYDAELALRLGASIDQVNEASSIDPWFLAELKALVDFRQTLIGPRARCRAAARSQGLWAI